MTLTSKVAQAARKRTERPMPRVLVVKDVWHLTPNMIRVVFAGPELDGFPKRARRRKLQADDPRKWRN